MSTTTTTIKMGFDTIEINLVYKDKELNQWNCMQRAPKKFCQRGTNVLIGGDSKFFGWGGTGPDGGGLHLDGGGGAPPIPPHTGQPWVENSETLTENKDRTNILCLYISTKKLEDNCSFTNGRKAFW